MHTIIKDKIAANITYVTTFQKIKQFLDFVQHSSNKQHLYFQQKIIGIHATKKMIAIIKKYIIIIPPSMKSPKS
jgi:hypothetical protein